MIDEDDVEWEVADSEIAEVEDGKVTGLQKGTTVITVRYQGKETEISVTVR